MRKFGKFLLGAILGGFLGSAIVLLFAPESGDETREAFKIRFDNFASQIKDAINERREELMKEIENYKSAEE